MNVGFRLLKGQEDWEWVNSILPLDLTTSTTGLMCYEIGTQRRLAAMVCESWTENSCQCHLIVDHIAALRHGFLQACADYVFTTGERKKMIGIVPSKKYKALRLNKRLGFKEVGRIADAFEDGNDAVILEVHRDDCTVWSGYTHVAPLEVANG